MKKLLTIIGARPQIIKAAALNRTIRQTYSSRLEEVLVHTGQHYDHSMSDVFFNDMDIPPPDHQLNIGSGSHGSQTGKMLDAIEKVIGEEGPDAVVVYGDTNSTLAGSLAAAKTHVPVIHVEAGLRSFKKQMPEEINRITADHVSTLLFSPTRKGLENLEREGFAELEHAMRQGRAGIDNPYVFHCGDLMYDNTLFYNKLANKRSGIFGSLEVDPNNFLLVTVHRPQNTDDPKVLEGILNALNDISETNDIQIVLPLHPRTAKAMENLDAPTIKTLKGNNRFKLVGAVGFLEMMVLEKQAKMIMTDSGGVQKEAFFMKRPCIILRTETEWTEIVECGCAVLAGTDPLAIKDGFTRFKEVDGMEFPELFGNGQAAEFICDSIIENLD